MSNKENLKFIEMKKIITEFRRLMAVWFMNWSFNIMPDCSFKIKYAEFIYKHLEDFK